MFHLLRSLTKPALVFPIAFLWSCSAISQSSNAVAPKVDSKAMAEKIIRPSGGVAAIVFDEKGDPTALVTKEGLTVPACRACTPELEQRYGPQCAKAPRASDPDAAAKATTPLICNKLTNTTVRAVKPVSVLRHTGSECMSFFFDLNGEGLVYQYCW